MADTRIVTGLIADPHGDPWPDFAIDFVVKPGVTTATETLPATFVSVSTGADGAFATELVVNVQYEVRLSGAFQSGRSSSVYPKGTIFDIVVPDGDDPISLSEIRAANISPATDPTLVNLLTAHTSDTDNPHQVTAAQTGAYTTTEVDTLLDNLTVTGVEGPAGADGASAYEVAVADGFGGDETAWLASLVGPQGPAGADGSDGTNGTDGADGTDGASAYEVAVANGFVGDASAWLASLVGEQGPQGEQGPAGATGDPGPGVAAGGTTGQMLAKQSGADYDTAWVDAPSGGSDLIGTTDTTKTVLGSSASANINSTAMGVSANGGGQYSVAIGELVRTSGSLTVAIGRSAQADHARSIALGAQASSSALDRATVKVNEMEIVRSSGTGATTIILTSPNGTRYVLGVDDTGTLTITPA